MKTVITAPLVGLALCASAAAAQDAAPTPPDGAPASFQLPAREADGRWRTPNRELTADETVWHVRVALNVAALGCRGPDEPATVAAYNALLAERKAALAAAMAGSEAAYKARHGEAWRARHDDAMTRLYNFWAQPPARDAFCREARAVLAEAASVEPSGFAGWARASLDRLEAPFTRFYDAFDGYRVRLADHQARGAQPVVLAATVAPVPVAVGAVLAAAPAEPPAPAPVGAEPTHAPITVAAVTFPIP